MPPTAVTISSCKKETIKNFIQTDLEFDTAYEESLKKLYFAYKNTCTHSWETSI